MMKIRVLVVDDSAFMRKVIADMIQQQLNIEVIDTAKNGAEAVEKIKLLKPDVVTLDIEMPIMDGLTALEKIMETEPLPVIMLSSLTKEGADATIRSLELGAVDFITKPSSVFKINTEDVKNELISKIVMASKISMKTKNTRKMFDFKKEKDESVSKTVSSGQPKVSKTSESSLTDSQFKRAVGGNRIDKIVAIGTSTGGPRALQSVIPRIPGNINASFIVVQHMPPGFTKSLAERMNTLSELNVKEAENGDILKQGWVYIAPGDQHLKLRRSGSEWAIQLTQDDLVSGHRPSVDAMMYSIADQKIPNVVGVIMTGMGADGAKGLVRVKNENKGYVIAQDEESCVVFGMPKSTIQLGCVDKVVTLNDIANEIVKAVGV